MEIPTKEDTVLPSSRLNELLAAAETSRNRAYAPYSQYRVGCAILGEDGVIYSGCNVENASYGLAICAERNAISTMVANGCQRWLEAVVVTKDSGSPCGMCRQTLSEFAPDDTPAFVHCFDENGNKLSHSIQELLPYAFKLK